MPRKKSVSSSKESNKRSQSLRPSVRGLIPVSLFCEGCGAENVCELPALPALAMRRAWARVHGACEGSDE